MCFLMRSGRPLVQDRTDCSKSIEAIKAGSLCNGTTKFHLISVERLIAYLTPALAKRGQRSSGAVTATLKQLRPKGI